MRLNMMLRIAAGLFAGMLISGVAQAGDTPAELAGVKLVGAEEVVKAQSAGAVIIDSRVASEYAEGHIKGAINVPYREKSEKAVNFDAAQDEFNLAKLPADKAAAVVVYCNGPECWKSFKGSTVAMKGGYTNVLWYREGFPQWKSKGLPSE
ncbi:MAG TPA: rhodanese-like domain-containing protein [Candidatus Acidoferrum sp.]|jgi:rhodanese-related sulfurtransferase|nr:rhodanese-like domain-containing protein [Candidatus Acidoferrum sp.]